MCSNFIMAGVHFIILKINGVDVNHLPHDEAVRMFLNASDPIHIEVCRKRDSHCKQYDNNEGGNIANNSRRDSETALTATPTLDQKNKQRFTSSDDGQLLTGLVLCQTACEPTIATTPTTNRKRVNSASSAAHNNRSSPQKHHSASATSASAKSLTLYFPPPPPIHIPATATLDQQRAADVDQVEKSGDTTTKTYIIRRSSLSNATKTDDNSKLANNGNSCSSNARLQPPPAPSLQKGSAVEDSTNAESFSQDTNPKLISTAIQTDVNDFVHSLFHVSNAATTEEIIEQEHNLFEACLAPEIDIEEITLRKSDSNEHLGLAVCYSLSGSSSGNNNSNVTANGVAYGSEENETCTEVYISDIQPDSIAGRDGRLRQGDQILQVNGKDVTNKKETETLIAENNNAVTLLVSRYLYADEDDFNDTCVAGLDVEDEEDDDDDEAYYNESNIAYENCFITPNEHCSTAVEAELNRALLETTVTTTATPTIALTMNPLSTTTTTTTTIAATVSPATKSDDSPCKTAATTTLSTTALPTKPSTTSSQKIKTSNRSHLLLKYDPLNHLSIKAHLNKVNQELAMLDSRVENMMMKPGPPTNAIDYDTEHIYETIPEDSESEPFYCSPYESSTGYVGPLVAANHSACPVDPTHLQQQKQRVAAWLGMQPAQRQHIVNANGRSNTLLHYPHGITTMETSTGGTIITSSSRSKSGTVRSAATTATTGTTGSTSSGGCGNLCQNEHENSSSAYNTGGSNNSGTALTLVLNSPHARNVLEQSEVEQMAALRISKSQRLLSPKEKLTSPKHQGVSSSAVANRTSSGVNCADFQVPTPPIRTAQQVASVTGGNTQQFSTSTMYTNVANLQQTMQLQQQLFRQALTQQQQQQQSHFFNLQQQQQQQHIAITPQQQQQQSLHMHTCPQFTAPNLSQYHFVSSQEVSVEQIRAAAAAAAAKVSNEEPMVWKVKRRQDGTRYIVRRPARTRMMRDRALRINAERENQELTTTEDDTISEIKTGRYWTREERKKHIERARERRQQQQQQLATAATMRISDKAVVSPTVIKCQINPPKEKPQQSSTNAQQQQPTVVSKLQRQSSTKLQHHQLQFGSSGTNQADPLKQKQVPLSITAMSTGATQATNVVITTATATGDTVVGETATTATCNNSSANTTLPATASNINATVVTGSATPSAVTVGAQTQPVTLQAPSNGNKMAGLLSVTTV